MHPACSHAVCQFMGCRDHPTEDSGDQERSVHRGASRNPCIGNAREYIFVFIYLFNCSWASSCCSLCAGVSDSSLFHCKENVKTSGKGREAPSIISLEHFPSQAPHTAIIGYFCTPLREDQSTWLFNEILEKTKLKIRVEEHQELTVDKTFSKVFHRQNFTVATISTSQWPWSPPPLHH